MVSPILVVTPLERHFTCLVNDPACLPVTRQSLPGNGPPYTTVYPIVVETFGPNGVEDHTYLVTQVCPTWPCMPATGLPPGFSASVATCTACGPSPVTATLTVPCEGTPAVSITTYERVYDYFCETGLGPSTYVVTQTCPNQGPCSVPASTIVPPNFTAVQSVCNAGCGPTPITATLTVPITPVAVATGTGICPGCAAPTATSPVMAGAPKSQQNSNLVGLVAGLLSLPLLVAGLL
ncbi:uncharacterized protein E0L32_000298 [Thyridium curvatum]|uniref:Uncharacterized protein n=1 Tax=Thyridium curvatum TaxID=1093900 RepID=A0A507BBF2_9PEZI|nr:uncharacterized protein E0L32_000298 [Thyridium curvatum]TPX15964.1 hypothetical protein E0L32_000298 [Thyridium curvatum]